MTSDSSVPRRRGRPKGDKRDRTRAALLEAARDLIRERGYERTTLEDIAEKAGMTTGAIYGNFANRNDLFIALAQTYWAPVEPQVRPGSTFAQVMRAVADATIAAMPERHIAVVGRLTGLAYTISHREMHASVRELTAQSYAAGAEWLASVTRTGDLPLPAPKLIPIIHALIEGLVLQRLLTPDLVPDDVIRAAFRMLASAPAPRRAR